MTNEEEYVQPVESQEVVETTEEPTNEEIGTEESYEDTVTLSKSEFTKLKRQAIAYKSQKENSPEPKSSSNITKDELYLVAKGYDDTAIDQLKVISRGSGVSLREAIDSDLFKIYQEKEQSELRKQKAKLGASNGSGYHVPQPTMKPDMTEAEHKAAWKKMMEGK